MQFSDPASALVLDRIPSSNVQPLNPLPKALAGVVPAMDYHDEVPFPNNSEFSWDLVQDWNVCKDCWRRLRWSEGVLDCSTGEFFHHDGILKLEKSCRLCDTFRHAIRAFFWDDDGLGQEEEEEEATGHSYYIARGSCQDFRIRRRKAPGWNGFGGYPCLIVSIEPGG